MADIGVAHVMRVFSAHFMESDEVGVHSAYSGKKPAIDLRSSATVVNVSAPVDQEHIVCDEEEIERAVRASGFSSPG